MRASIRLLLVVTAVLALPADALAAFGWNDPGDVVSAAGTYGPEGGSVAPDGTTFLFGWGSGVGSPSQLAVRPPGGPIGAPAPMTPPGAPSVQMLNTGGKPPVVGIDSAGDALIGSTAYTQVIYRAADGSYTAAQNLGAYGVPKAISVAPDGNALVGLEANGAVRVATRGPGAGSLFDTAGSVAFTNAQPLSLVGLQLDPDGAAIVVMKDDSGVLYQATRPAGGVFSGKTAIPAASGQGGTPTYPAFASSVAGDGVLGYVAGDTAVAAHREPGGALGAPQVVGTDPVFSEVSAVLPAVDEDGDGMVAWTHRLTTAPAGCADGGTYAIDASFLRDGAFAPAAELGTPAPDRSQLLRVAGAGHRVAMEYRTAPAGGDGCASSDDPVALYSRTYVSQTAGLTAEDDHTLATTVAQPSTASDYPSYELQGLNLALGANGTQLVTSVGGASANGTRLHVREDLSPAPTPAGTAPATQTVTATTATVTTTTTAPPSVGANAGPTAKPKPPPLVVKQLLKPAAITSQRPFETVSCPAAAGSACTVKLVVLPAHGSKRLGSGSATIAAGKKAKVRLALTKAGKAALKHKGVSSRLVVTIRAGGRSSTATLKTTIGRKKH